MDIIRGDAYSMPQPVGENLHQQHNLQPGRAAARERAQ